MKKYQFGDRVDLSNLFNKNPLLSGFLPDATKFVDQFNPQFGQMAQQFAGPAPSRMSRGEFFASKGFDTNNPLNPLKKGYMNAKKEYIAYKDQSRADNTAYNTKVSGIQNNFAPMLGSLSVLMQGFQGEQDYMNSQNNRTDYSQETPGFQGYQDGGDVNNMMQEDPWLAARSSIESSGNQNAISSAGAVGQFQITPIALKEFNRKYDSKYTWDQVKTNPETNAYVSQGLIKDIRGMINKVDTTLSDFDKNILAEMAYNYGPYRFVDKLKSKGKSVTLDDMLNDTTLPTETRNHGKKFVSHFNQTPKQESKPIAQSETKKFKGDPFEYKKQDGKYYFRRDGGAFKQINRLGEEELKRRKFQHGGSVWAKFLKGIQSVAPGHLGIFNTLRNYQSLNPLNPIGDVTAPQGILGNAVQATYTPGVTVMDALTGKKDVEKGFIEEVLTDPSLYMPGGAQFVKGVNKGIKGLAKFNKVATSNISPEELNRLRSIQSLSSLTMDTGVPRATLIKKFLRSGLNDSDVKRLSGKTLAELEEELKRTGGQSKSLSELEHPINSNPRERIQQIVDESMDNPHDPDFEIEDIDDFVMRNPDWVPRPRPNDVNDYASPNFTPSSGSNMPPRVIGRIELPDNPNIRRTRQNPELADNMMTGEDMPTYRDLDPEMVNMVNESLGRLTNPNTISRQINNDITGWRSATFDDISTVNEALSREFGHTPSAKSSAIKIAKHQGSAILDGLGGVTNALLKLPSNIGENVGSFLGRRPKAGIVPNVGEIDGMQLLGSLSKYHTTNADVMGKITESIKNLDKMKSGYYNASSSLSDNSAPLYYKNLSRLLDTRKDIDVGVTGFAPLNSLGYLANSGLTQPEDILKYLNHQLANTTFRGKKLPEAFINDTGNHKTIMIPDVVIKKKQHGGMINKFQYGGSPLSSMFSNMDALGKVLSLMDGEEEASNNPIKLTGSKKKKLKKELLNQLFITELSKQFNTKSPDMIPGLIPGISGFNQPQDVDSGIPQSEGYPTDSPTDDPTATASRYIDVNSLPSRGVNELPTGSRSLPVPNGNVPVSAKPTYNPSGRIGSELMPLPNDRARDRRINGMDPKDYFIARDPDPTLLRAGIRRVYNRQGKQIGWQNEDGQFAETGNNFMGRIEGSTPRYNLSQKQAGGRVSSSDSLRHQARKTMDYEYLRGSEYGTGLSNYGNPALGSNPTSDQAVEWYMQNIAPQLGSFNTAMEKGEAGDFLYNTGRDPRIYMLDQYLQSKGQSGLANRGSYNMDSKSPEWISSGKKQQLDQEWAKYEKDINKLSENDRRILLNKGRDFYYQNINKENGQPNHAYDNSWYGRIWNTNEYTPFNPNDPRFNRKKQEGGNVNMTGYLPGSPTENNPYNIIPGGNITMQGVNQNIMGIPMNNGQPIGKPVKMKPGLNYYFPNAEAVLEIPTNRFGGLTPTLSAYAKFQMGGEAGFAPIQTERGEKLYHLDRSISNVAAKKLHKNMMDDEVTDIVADGTFVGSRDPAMKVSKKEADNIIMGSYAVKYEAGKPTKLPKNQKFGDIMTKKYNTPAELMDRIAKKFPISDKPDNIFTKTANEENLASRDQYMNIVKYLTEVKKPVELGTYKYGGKVKKYQAGAVIGALGSLIPQILGMFTQSANKNASMADISKYQTDSQGILNNQMNLGMLANLGAYMGQDNTPEMYDPSQVLNETSAPYQRAMSNIPIRQQQNLNMSRGFANDAYSRLVNQDPRMAYSAASTIGANGLRSASQENMRLGEQRDQLGMSLGSQRANIIRESLLNRQSTLAGVRSNRNQLNAGLFGNMAQIGDTYYGGQNNVNNTALAARMGARGQYANFVTNMGYGIGNSMSQLGQGIAGLGKSTQSTFPPQLGGYTTPMNNPSYIQNQHDPLQPWKQGLSPVYIKPR